MLNSSHTLIAIFFVVLQFGVLTVSAVVGCAAEANFQECKSIENKLLAGCGPVDYACQCNAHHLIHQCYNLCPEYSIDANEQARVASAICVAVPTTSAVLPSRSVVSQTWWPSTTTGSVSAPTASQSTTASFGIQISPATGLVCVTALLASLLQW
ncbi:unnamed protein product [Mucor hiemalis]